MYMMQEFNIYIYMYVDDICKCPDRAICKSSIAHCEKPPHGNITILHNPLSSSLAVDHTLHNYHLQITNCRTVTQQVTV